MTEETLLNLRAVYPRAAGPLIPPLPGRRTLTFWLPLTVISTEVAVVGCVMRSSA